MKKLFLIVATVAMSFAASASTVTWGASSASAIDATKITEGTFYLMYASSDFDATQFKGDTFSTATLAAAGLDKTFDTFAYSSSKTSQKNTGITPASTGVSAGNGLTVYEVLISSDGKNLAYGQTTMNLAAATGMNQNKMLSSFTYVAASGDGPEPTSGLLLLVGAGILGLRRKRA